MCLATLIYLLTHLLIEVGRVEFTVIEVPDVVYEVLA